MHHMAAQVVSEKLSAHVIQNYAQFVEGVNEVTQVGACGQQDPPCRPSHAGGQLWDSLAVIVLEASTQPNRHCRSRSQVEEELQTALVTVKQARGALALAQREVASNLKIAQDTRRKQGLTALLEALLKLQQAASLQRALKWVAEPGLGWLCQGACRAIRALQPPISPACRALIKRCAACACARPPQGGPGEWRVCRGLLAVRAVRAQHGGAGPGPESGAAGAGRG